MRSVIDLCDKLIEQAVPSGAIDRNDIVEKLIDAVDDEGRRYILYEGCGKIVSSRLRTRSISSINGRLGVQRDLFDAEIHALYPVDDDDGRRWKVVSALSQLEACAVLERLKAHEEGTRRHRLKFEAMVRAAKAVWHDAPRLSLGEALQRRRAA